MRIDFTPDLPHELPRRQSPDPTATESLGPSPIEIRKERLAKQAEENAGHSFPPVRRNLATQIEKPQEAGDRPLALDRHVDHRPRRDRLPAQSINIALRSEEEKTLTELGRFRVIATADIAETVYGNRHARMERDLAFLRNQGLVTVNAVNARRDGRGGRIERIEVAALTKTGRDLVRQMSGLPQDQKLYAGMVKPREIEHDTQIYRAYLKETQRIKKDGGTNVRVRLDFELKAQIQKAIYAERKADPKRELNDIKQQVARDLDLPFVNGGIQIPDARIEYDLPRKNDHNLDQGTRTGHEDIEVLTAAYRPGHLRNKAQAGFRVYASQSDRATLTAKIEGDHHLLENILEL